MVNDVKNYDKKDAKNSDIVGKFSFFRTPQWRKSQPVECHVVCQWFTFRNRASYI
jgi:hypothetical protein